MITCVCVCGEDWERVWVKEIEVAAVVSVLNRASRIYAWNGAHFDLPFMQRVWKLSDTQVGLWMSKLVDPLYVASGLVNMWEKLQSVLERNGLAGKCGTGAEAVQLARDGKWDELGKYCLVDTRQTYLLLANRDSILYNDRITFILRPQVQIVLDSSGGITTPIAP